MSAYVQLPPSGQFGGPAAPPFLGSEPPREPLVHWSRRVGMLAILSGYLLAILLRRAEPSSSAPALPENLLELLTMLGFELGVFATVMGAACWLGRPTRHDLYAGHGPTFVRWVLGFVWSLALRFGLGVMVAGILTALQAVLRRSGPAALDAYRPKVENLVPLQALKDPVYLLVVCTVVSFVVAGLREELWRAGTIFAFASLLPSAWSQRGRDVAGVLLAAFLFGCAHSNQGAAGMLLTGLLGLLLGLIMVFRASLWEAVLAHGFFDATTFLLLRVLLDRELMEEWVNRAGLPPEITQPLLDQLSEQFKK